MVACFLGCLKCGHPYVPIDMHSVPDERVKSIVAQIGDPLIFDCGGGSLFAANSHCVNGSALHEIIAFGGQSNPENWVVGEDLAYIIFTSGSTGAPKGVQVTSSCFDNFCEWALTIGGTDKRGQTFMNQAPFSFDLSVYELAMSLWAGGTLWCLEKETLDDTAALFSALQESGVNVWVSTPSFADLCLANKAFIDQVIPDVELFLFCGEVLTNQTAQTLQQRFPRAAVVNTYGPTESTVAVTEVIVTREIAQAQQPIPCGKPRPGTRIRITDESGLDQPIGELGEIVIEGDTVAAGYFGRPDLTERSFATAMLDGQTVRTYRTGDEGFVDELGILHYRGRIDLQIKLNGFRIELGDIEENLRKLPQVNAAAVIAIERDGKVSHLIGHVVASGPRSQTDFREGLALKEALKGSLPHYMIPRKFVFHETLPMTPNGKIDRRVLAAL